MAVLSPAGGVQIDGFDVARTLPPDVLRAIRRALSEHHIVVFPGQSVTREQQFAFAAQFGEVETPDPHRFPAKRVGVAHIISNLDAAGNPTVRMSAAANYHWHTDKPYRRAPPFLTVLHAIELPPRGGDTEFANTALAYEALADDTKRRIAGLRIAFRPAFDPNGGSMDHPLVRTHPETGRKALYLGNHATDIVGMPEAESAALLQALLDHATQRRFVYAHRWRVGDLVMWDNRCLLHRVVVCDELRRHRRVLHRSVVKGAVPF